MNGRPMRLEGTYDSMVNKRRVSSETGWWDEG